MKEEIVKALEQLDPANDEHWTADGLPSLEAVQERMSVPVSRLSLTTEANGFNRSIAASLKESREQDQEDDPLASDPNPEVDPLDGSDLVADAPQSTAEARQAELQANLDALTEAIEEHDLAVSKAAQMRESMVQERDEAIKALHAEFPPVQQAEATRIWLEQQAKQRAERAGQQFVVPGGKSPIDQSFQRRSGHGHGRKQVPVFN